MSNKFENPFNLDYLGVDFKECFQHDQQDYQNRTEYAIIKRAIERKKLKRNILTKVKHSDRMKKLGLPKCFQCEEDSEAKLNIPNVIHSENTGGKGILVRTEQKPANIDKNDNEYRRRKDKLTNLARQHILNQNKEKPYEALIDYNSKHSQLPHKFKDALKFKGNLADEIEYSKKRIRKRAEIMNNAGISTRMAVAPNLFVGQEEASGNNDIKWSSSSDDEDGLSVGRTCSREYMLRGFHQHNREYQRGKHNRAKDTLQHTCMTRQEWLNKLLEEAISPRKSIYNKESSRNDVKVRE